MMIWAKVKTASLAAAAALCATAGIGASVAGDGPAKAVGATPRPMLETAAVPEAVRAEVETMTDAIPQEPPKAAADLVGHWTFDEADGEKVEDASGQGHAGTFQGSVKRGDGKLGKALVFDGSGGHVEIFKTTVLDAVHQNSYTVAAWFKPENLPPGTEDANDATYGIVLRSGWHLGIAYNGEGKFIMTHWTAPETWAGAGSWEDTYPPGRWHHVAGVVDRPAGTVKIYVNGEEKGTGEFAAGAEPKAYETSWKIGIGGPGAEKWAWPAKGAIDDVRLYRKALTADEVKALFEGK